MSSTGDKHIRALDGVRGIAVLIILFHHFGQFAGFSGLLAKMVDGAWIGVDLFFVLSGFLITGILLNSKGTPHYFRNFYARRTLRVFPLYYGVIAVCILCAFFIPSLRDIWRLQGWLWFYGTNVKIAFAKGWVFRFGPVDLNHFWSLAVEEHFYLVWPALVLWLNPRQLLKACIVLIVAALGCRVLLDARHRYIAAYVITPCRIDLLASGAVVAILLQSERGSELLRRWMWVVLLLCLTAAAFINYRGRGEILSLTRNGIIYYDALAGIFAALVWFAATVNPASMPGRVLGNAPLVAFGRWSYGIYVYHHIIRGLMPTGLPSLVFFFGGIAISVLVAAASWKFFEQPILRFKRLFPRHG